MSHRELVSVGAAWWVGMGRKNRVLSSPGLLEAGNAFGCCHCCFAPVFGAGVSLSLALRKGTSWPQVTFQPMYSL